MRVILEVLSTESINYTDKTGKPASFDVINCREQSPATVLAPVRLSARDFPTVKPGTVVTVAVSDVRCGKLDKSISLRGVLVNGAK